MDWFSLMVGFIFGAFTAAAGQYLGQKYTDQRRSKEIKKKSLDDFHELVARFPKVLDEMKQDLNQPECMGIRKFFVTKSNINISHRGNCFMYYADVHRDLEAAIYRLEELGYIEDITPGNCPMYRINEEFVDLLQQENK